jgi:DNA-directed RNA polymerase alpha subunit
MKTLPAEVREQQLHGLISQWVEENGLLKPGEMLLVNLEIQRPDPIKVKLTGYEGPSDPDKTLLTELDFSVRTSNSLSNANLVTVGDVRGKTLEEMRAYKNVWKKSLLEIRDKFQEIGIELDWDFKGL